MVTSAGGFQTLLHARLTDQLMQGKANMRTHTSSRSVHAGLQRLPLSPEQASSKGRLTGKRWQRQVSQSGKQAQANSTDADDEEGTTKAE